MEEKMNSILEQNKKLTEMLVSSEELQKILAKITVQLIAVDIMPVKDQKPVASLLREAAIILEKNEIFLNKDELKEAVATWAARKITWRIEKV